MLKHILAGILLLLVFKASAQEPGNNNEGGSILGKVFDSLTNKPIEYAAISLFRQGSDKPVNGTVTNAEGSYILKGVGPGNYKILAEFIGCYPHTSNVITIGKKSAVYNIGDIVLSRSHKTLQNVTVSSSKALIENKIDKLVFNAEKDITSQGGVAADILKKIPQVSVDVDGNVELAGSTSIRFLINGKPSSAFGSSIAEVLQSIPASQVKSIEVITNPGAKYDAQGIGGIINIILKQSRVKGVNGNLSVSAGTRNENGSFNINARKGNIGFNVFISGNARPSVNIRSNAVRSSSDTAAKKNITGNQSGIVRFQRQGMESGLGFDWTYRKKNNLTGSVHFGSSGNSGTGDIDQLQVITSQAGGSIVSETRSFNHTQNEFHFNNTDVSLSYKRTFNREDQELEVSVNSSFENNHGKTGNYLALMPQDSLFYGTSSRIPGRQNEKELQLDYTQPVIKDIIFGTGGKIYSMDISSNPEVSSYEPLSKTYSYDSSLSIKLNYKQKVYALYAEVSFPAGNIFDARIGGRYERTENRSFYSNAQQQARQHGYNTFVPSIFLLKRLNGNKTLKLSYSRRIQRPEYNDLNPFINTTDPKNISAGNPYLLPETGHRIELSFSHNYEKAGSFMITAFYRINENDIQPFIIYYPSLKVGDSVYTNVAVNTRSNIGTEKNMGLNTFADLHLSAKLSIRTNISFYRRHTVNVLNPGYNSNSLNYRFNVNASCQFAKDLAGEFFGNFNSPRNEAQGRYPSFTTYSIALRKQFWNKKGSLAFSATNPFSEIIDQRTELSGPNFNINNLRRIPFRSVGLNFTWKFGKLEFKKEKDENKDAIPSVPEGN